MKVFVALLAVGLPALAAAHSWIVCTDYLENNGWYWDQAKCRAWPRGANRHNLRFGNFGSHRGFLNKLDNHPEETALCQYPRNDDTEYTDVMPMAAYYLGQKVVLTHPTNGHVADARCKNTNIYDTENLIFVVDGDEDPCCINSTKLIVVEDMGISPYDVRCKNITNIIDTENLIFAVDGDEDPCCIDSDKLIVVEDMGISPYGPDIDPVLTTTYPKPGYQNAPKFCEDEGSAMATYNFTIPLDMKPGCLLADDSRILPYLGDEQLLNLPKKADEKIASGRRSCPRAPGASSGEVAANFVR
uniref:Uncharacterized protein n=1 Tax=Branchiostoma floridae TaxID=7739 RepID=C3Z8P9_BRAFL|eukprot:XP_002595143.1 hypothetical protein BRAFLDRAFT_67932 [Branchiostoma floridae]